MPVKCNRPDNNLSGRLGGKASLLWVSAFIFYTFRILYFSTYPEGLVLDGN